MNQSTFPQPICDQIWNMKYRFQTEREGFKSDLTVEDTWNRIANACANVPRLHNNVAEREALAIGYYQALKGFGFLPAGRITSGAGTQRNVTLFNCFVMGTIPDSLDGIFDMLKEAALTMQQGGGIGYDFSTLRPKGALVKGVESNSSGPLSFMDVWDAMCRTIMSAGSRRGAMMATMRCDHPDIMDFITAKQDKARLRNFNVSVLCTDVFMEAVKNDLEWDLEFDGKVYQTVKAKDLWNAILENTYGFAEPGVIFIDRINEDNNLRFIETIAATNPCGEQPLPPYGACLLGSINLTQVITNPFTLDAGVDGEKLDELVATAVSMLDSVIDTSGFPLEEQRQEALYKRRMGLGVTGLADLLFMTGHVYGSQSAVELTERIMKRIAIAAYRKSIELAKEIGPAPCLETREAREALIQSGFMQRLPELHDDILEHGLRNGLLLSIAPTGTISMYAGNVSSGIEPIFAPEYERKVTNEDGTKRTEKVFDYAVLKFHEHFDNCVPFNGDAKSYWWSQFMTSAQELKPLDHIVMQAAAQKWVDSSISKTVNCPEDISFEDFEAVYMVAYHMGCKGCTTYRPNDVTGSVLSVTTDESPVEKGDPELPKVAPLIADRPEAVDGTTYKLRWNDDAYYVTINQTHDDERNWFAPFEIFVMSKNPEHAAWIAALTRMISAIFRKGGDVRFVVEEMKNVFDPKGGQWVKGRYVPSLVAFLGDTLQQHLDVIGYQSTPEIAEPIELLEVRGQPEPGIIPDQCPSCKEFSMVKVSGCPTCSSCGYSKCG